jgi:hypothetical protein
MLEEAVQLLRTSPAGVVSVYLAGAVPFTLAWLYFVPEAGRGRNPDTLLLSLGVAAAYLWLQCTRAVFAAHLRGALSGERARTDWRRAVVTQTALQGWKPLVLPIAWLAILPGPWVSTFFRNVAACAAHEGYDVGHVFRYAARQASLWQQPNWLMLGIVALLAIAIALNLAATLAFLPLLLKAFTGYESTFARAGHHFFANPTFWWIVLSLTWLLIDPLLTAAYVVRCFHGESLESGEDIRAALRRLRSVGVAATALLVVTPCLSAAVPAERIDSALEKVLERREYQWRLPKTQAASDKRGTALVVFMNRVVKRMQAVAAWVADGLERVLRWLTRGNSGLPRAGKGGPASSQTLQWWMAGIAVVIIAAGSWLVLHKRVRSEPNAVPAAGAVDLEDSALVADQLPEEEWLELARQCADRGELRAALRALYLGNLAMLARMGLLAIAASKSNREYREELRRKASGQQGMHSRFAANIGSFERSWYGRHEVTLEQLRTFEENLSFMRALAGGSVAA